MTAILGFVLAQSSLASGIEVNPTAEIAGESRDAVQGKRVAVSDMESAILAELRAMYPAPAALSGNGSRLLTVVKPPTKRSGNQLRVASVEGRRLVGSLEEERYPFRIRFSEDGRSVAYFARKQESMLKELFIWFPDIDSTVRHRIPMSHAQPQVRWSGDGVKLAFTSLPECMVVANVVEGSTAKHALSAVDFDWAPDSERLSVIDKLDSSLKIIRAVDGKILRRWTFSRLGILQQVVWDGDSTSNFLLLRFFDAVSGMVKLAVCDPDDGSIDVFYEGMDYFVALNRGDGGVIAATVRSNAQTKVLLWKNERDRFSTIGFPGSIKVLSVDAASDSVTLLHANGRAYRFIRASLSDSEVSVIDESSSGLKGQYSDGEIFFDVPDVGRHYAWLSRLIKPRSNAAIVLVTTAGAEAFWLPQQWAETQLYLLKGIHVLQLQIPRERHHASVIVSACEYLNKELGVPPERIVVAGESEAASSVVAASQHESKRFKTIIVSGLLSADPLPAEAEAVAPWLKVFAFHGGKDPYRTSGYAKIQLQTALGESSESPSNVTWRVFKDEYHGIVRDENRGAMVAAALKALEDPTE